jgi:hypothetical protein
VTIIIDDKWRAKSWSYSAISAYEQCPLQYYLGKAEGLVAPQGRALVEGNRIHMLAEKYLLGELKEFPYDLSKFSKEFKNLKKHKAKPEEVIVLDRHWQPVKSDDPWLDPKAWIRAKIDARVNNLVVDFKTGRFYDAYEKQASLYATLLFQAYPDIGDEIDVEFWFLKSADVAQYSYKKSDQMTRLDHWDSKASKLMQEDRWHPRRNEWCKYCHVQEHCDFYKV